MKNRLLQHSAFKIANPSLLLFLLFITIFVPFLQSHKTFALTKEVKNLILTQSKINSTATISKFNKYIPDVSAHFIATKVSLSASALQLVKTSFLNTHKNY